MGFFVMHLHTTLKFHALFRRFCTLLTKCALLAVFHAIKILLQNWQRVTANSPSP